MPLPDVRFQDLVATGSSQTSELHVFLLVYLTACTPEPASSYVKVNVTVVEVVDSAPSLIMMEPVGATVSNTMESQYELGGFPALSLIW